MHTIGRRTFIASASAAASAGWLAALPAAEPVSRVGKVPWRLSLAGYSLRKYLTAEPGSQGALDLIGLADYAAELGYDAIEPTSYYFPETGVLDFVHTLKRKCFLLGLDISSGAIRNNFTLPPGDELDHWMQHVHQWIDFYAELGAPVIRVFAGKPSPGVSPEEAIERSVQNLATACEMAGRRGVVLALENHDFLTDVERMLAIVRQVDSPWFGVNWDSGNFHSDDPYADLARIAPYAVTAQIKVEMHRPDGRPEPADLRRLLAILHETGYRGAIVLEYEAAEDPYQAIPGYTRRLRQAMEEFS